MILEIDVKLSGSIAHGYAPAIVRRYKERVDHVLAERGQSMIRAFLPEQYMYLGHHGGDPKHNPIPPGAGDLAASITVERAVNDAYLIRGDLVVYGAWIEGDAPGNEIVWRGRLRRGLPGRFPGYHAFRLISIVLDNMAVEVAEAELPMYLGELNA